MKIVSNVYGLIQRRIKTYPHPPIISITFRFAFTTALTADKLPRIGICITILKAIIIRIRIYTLCRGGCGGCLVIYYIQRKTYVKYKTIPICIYAGDLSERASACHRASAI